MNRRYFVHHIVGPLGLLGTLQFKAYITRGGFLKSKGAKGAKKAMPSCVRARTREGLA